MFHPAAVRAGRRQTLGSVLCRHLCAISTAKLGAFREQGGCGNHLHLQCLVHRGSSAQHNLPGGRSTLTSLPESLSPHRDGKNQAQRGSGTCLCHNAHVRVRNTLCPSPCPGLSPCGISMLFALLSFSPGRRPSCSAYYTTADKKPQVLVTRALCFINEALP